MKYIFQFITVRTCQNAQGNNQQSKVSCRDIVEGTTLWHLTMVYITYEMWSPNFPFSTRTVMAN